MIVQFGKGTIPLLTRQSGLIGLWNNVDGEQHGFVFDTEQASDVALGLLRETAALSGDNLPVFEAQSLSIDLPENITSNSYVRLVFEVNGAPIALVLTLDQLGELAAANMAMSRIIDAGFTPRNNSD